MALLGGYNTLWEFCEMSDLFLLLDPSPPVPKQDNKLEKIEKLDTQ